MYLETFQRPNLERRQDFVENESFTWVRHVVIRTLFVLFLLSSHPPTKKSSKKQANTKSKSPWVPLLLSCLLHFKVFFTYNLPFPFLCWRDKRYNTTALGFTFYALLYQLQTYAYTFCFLMDGPDFQSTFCFIFLDINCKMKLKIFEKFKLRLH